MLQSWYVSAWDSCMTSLLGELCALLMCIEAAVVSHL
jgi:hypothetical protein